MWSDLEDVANWQEDVIIEEEMKECIIPQNPENGTYQLSPDAVRIVKIKKRCFHSLYYDQGVLWEGMFCEKEKGPPEVFMYRKVLCTGEYTQSVTDVQGITAPLKLSDIRSTYRGRIGKL
jgi:hypothetical protein